MSHGSSFEKILSISDEVLRQQKEVPNLSSLTASLDLGYNPQHQAQEQSRMHRGLRHSKVPSELDGSGRKAALSSWAADMNTWLSKGGADHATSALHQKLPGATSAKLQHAKKAPELEQSKNWSTATASEIALPLLGALPAKPRRWRAKGRSADMSSFQDLSFDSTPSPYGAADSGFRSFSPERGRSNAAMPSPQGLEPPWAPVETPRQGSTHQSELKRFSRSTSCKAKFGSNPSAANEERESGNVWDARSTPTTPTTPKRRSRRISYDFDKDTAQYYGVDAHPRSRTPQPFQSHRESKEGKGTGGETQVEPVNSTGRELSSSTTDADSQHAIEQHTAAMASRSPNLRGFCHTTPARDTDDFVSNKLATSQPLGDNASVLVIDCDTEAVDTSEASDAERFLHGRA